VHLAKSVEESFFFYEKLPKGFYVCPGSKSFKVVLNNKQDRKYYNFEATEPFGKFWNYVVPKEFL